MAAERPATQLRPVILWMSGTFLSFCLLAVSIRELSGGLSVFQILAVRNVAGIVILTLAALRVAQGQGIGAPRPLKMHLLRNVPHFAAQACWAFGLTVLPMATVFALEFTTPAWTMVMAVLFLHEKATRGRVAALVLGFLGVLVILRPGVASFRPEALVVLGAAILFGIQITTTKFLTGSNSTINILFWMNVMQLPLNLGATWVIGGAPLPPLTWAMLPALLGLSVSGLAAHVCLTNAFRHGDATLVVPIDFLRIPLIALVGAALYHERVDVMVLAGAAISGCGILISLVEQSRRR